MMLYDFNEDDAMPIPSANQAEPGPGSFALIPADPATSGVSIELQEGRLVVCRWCPDCKALMVQSDEVVNWNTGEVTLIYTCPACLCILEVDV